MYFRLRSIFLSGQFRSSPHAFVVVALCIGASNAHATILNWNNPLGGAASTAGNWMPAQVPGNIDDLIFNLNNNYTVTWNAAVATVRTHTYRDGVVTLSISSPHTVNTDFEVGDLAGDVATATLTTGMLTCNANAQVGNAIGSTGTLNVNDDDALFQVSGALSDLSIGLAGTGALSITGGGEVLVANDFFLGFSNSGVGNATVSGFNLFPLASSRLATLNAGTGDINVGFSGDGTLTIANGAVVESAADIAIAQSSTANGTVTIGGAGLTNAMLNAVGDLDIGRNGSASAAGTGTLEVNADATVTIAGTTTVGDPDGGFGTLRVTNGGEFRTQSLVLNDSNSSLQHTGGMIIVDGGPFDPAGTTFTVNGANTPWFQMLGGATTTLASAAAPFRALTVGSTQLGTLTMHQLGTSCTITSGNVVVGNSAGSDGLLVVDQSATLTVPAGWAIIVGNAGTGDLLLGGGATVTTPTAYAGFLPTGDGVIRVNTPSAELNVTSDLYIGGDAAGPQGAGRLEIENAGDVNATGPGVNMIVWSTGIVDVNANGTLNSTGEIEMHGQFNLAGGVVNAVVFDVINGDVTGFGTINAEVDLGAAVSTVTATGTLIMGDPATITGFSNNGGLAVGPHAVTLLDANVALPSGGGDQWTIAGGSVTAANGISHTAADVLTGFGTINGAFNNFGTITPTGTGLTFNNGILSGVGAGIAGTRITFGSTGGFTGAGSIAAEVFSNNGSVITANGNLTMGNALSGSGISLSGELHVGAHTVTLHDSGLSGLGSLTTINGGTLNAANGVALGVIPTLDTLRGVGLINGNFTNSGVVEPGNSTGTLFFANNYTQTATLTGGDLRMEIAGPGVFDRLQVTGAASLDGDLFVIGINNFLPFVNQQFAIITAASVVGTFDNVIVSGIHSCFDVQIVYSASDVRVQFVASACRADIAPAGVGNGVVNIDDLLLVINSWGMVGGYGDITTCGTGPVNIDDLLGVINSWGICP